MGNLPYSISTPILFQLLDQAACILDMHFMLQKEVVDRMAAGTLFDTESGKSGNSVDADVTPNAEIADFREFQEYQEWRRHQGKREEQMEFKEWREWKAYKEWKAQQQ